MMMPLILLSLATALPSGEAPPVFRHDGWAAVLDRFVDEEGRVDYGGLAQDREDFDRYLATLRESGPVSTPELFPDSAHRLAYYINAYNALVFQGVLDGWPDLDSVWGLGTGYRFFVTMKVHLDGSQTSLKSLEDREIREAFKDPRVHAALNCASVGCPRLPREAFVAERLEQQLNAAMTEMANDVRHCRVDAKKRRIWLSKIFSWFRDDFIEWGGAEERGDAALIAYLNGFRSEEDAIPITYKVRYLPYDKGLNHF